MNIPKLIKKFLYPVKPPPELTKEQQDKAIEEIRENTYKRIARLKKLIYANKTGWSDFIEIINDYIEAIYIRKLKIKHNDLLIKPCPERDKALHKLALLDQDIYTLEWVISAPLEFITTAEQAEKDLQKEEENKSAAQ